MDEMESRDLASGEHEAAVRIRRQNDRASLPGMNPAMTRDIGVSKDTVGSVGIYAAIVTTAPGAKSDVHHHRECETAIYILSGQARFRYGPRLEQHLDAAAGDFVYIPAHTVHTEDNLSATDPLVVHIARNCPGPVTIPVAGFDQND